MLFLSDNDVKRFLTMQETIEAVEKAFKELSEGTAIILPRTTLMLENGSLSQMSACLKKMNVTTTKIIGIFPSNEKYNLPTTIATLMTNDLKTGKVIAVMDATHLTAVRTGAVTGVATKYLARKDAKTVGLIGCGAQGRTQAWAMTEVRKIEKIKAYDKVAGRKIEFVEEASKKLDVDVAPVDTAEEAVKHSDIIITATTSSEPVVKGEWVAEGSHINSIGSYYPDKRELDTQTILRAKVVVDLKEAALEEAGDIIMPIKEGAISVNHVYAELGEIVSGKKVGRSNNHEITVFKSVGLAIQDAAAAKLIIDKALRYIAS